MHVLDPAEVDFPFDRSRCSAAWRTARSAGRSAGDPQGLSGRVRPLLAQATGRLPAEAIDYVPLRTDRPLEVALSSYLASRGRGRVGIGE